MRENNRRKKRKKEVFFFFFFSSFLFVGHININVGPVPDLMHGEEWDGKENLQGWLVNEKKRFVLFCF